MDFWGIIYKIGFAVCHQLPDRTPAIDGYHLPLCARCSGLYLGIIAGYLYIMFMKKCRKGVLPEAPYGFILVGFLGITFIEALTTLFGLRQDIEKIRVFTGMISGSSIPLFSYPLFITEITDNYRDETNMGSIKDMVVLVVLIIIFFGGFYYLPIGRFFFISIVSTIGVLVIFFNLFGMLISLITKPRKVSEYIITVVLTICVITLIFSGLYLMHKYSLRFIE
jgi:uncharacterized membrane protein